MSTREYRAQAALVTTTPRDEYSYRLLFDIDPSENVLDLGSGRTQFSVLTNMVQLDHAYTDPSKRPDYPQRPIAAVYQELPFRDSSFDRVTCRYGNLGLGVEAAMETVSEALRVTKPGGRVQVFPAFASIHNRRHVASLRRDDYHLYFEGVWPAVLSEVADSTAPLWLRATGAVIAAPLLRTITIHKTEKTQTNPMELVQPLGMIIAGTRRN